MYKRQALIGRPWNAETLESACAAMRVDFQPISDMRASADYRGTAAANLLRKVFAETQQTAPAARVLA